MFSRSIFRLVLPALVLLAPTPRARAQSQAIRVGGPKPAAPAEGMWHLRPLPMARWLKENVVTVVTSPHDIGEIAAIFDGNSATILRSAQINPQQTTVQFDQAVSIAAIGVLVTNSGGRWKLAGSVWKEGASQPVRQEIVPWTNVENATADEIVLPNNLLVSELTLTVERVGGDDYVHLAEWELLTEVPVAADKPAPTEN